MFEYTFEQLPGQVKAAIAHVNNRVKLTGTYFPGQTFKWGAAEPAYYFATVEPGQPAFEWDQFNARLWHGGVITNIRWDYGRNFVHIDSSYGGQNRPFVQEELPVPVTP